MITAQVQIINPSGLHARPAADFVVEAKKYASTVRIRNLDENGEFVNGKSALRLLSQAFESGTTVELCVEGPDEQAAADALTALISSGFGE